MAVKESWLFEMNEELSRANIPEEQRPRVAQWEWKKSQGNSAESRYEDMVRINQWFRDRVNHHSIKVGPKFIGCYFYDDFFWPVVIPLIFGKVDWEPLYSINALPPRLLEKLESNREAKSKYEQHYSHCNIYGRRIRRLVECKDSSKFLNSACQHLDTSVKQLLDESPNPAVVQTSRMAVELFMKAYVDMFVGISDSKARKLGHNLKKCMNECTKLDSGTLFLNLADGLDVFPNVRERYEGKNYDRSYMWACYRLAQVAGSMLCRSFVISNVNRRR